MKIRFLRTRSAAYFSCLLALFLALPSQADVQLLSEAFNAPKLGNGANGDSIGSSMSDDGRFLAISTRATNLVANDNSRVNYYQRIFLLDRQEQTTTVVTESSSGNSQQPSISGNGEFIAFSSGVRDLVANDPNGSTLDIFVFDRENSSFELLTFGANSNSDQPSISNDGRFVAFRSNASDLVADDTNNRADIFVFDRDDSSLTNITAAGNGSSSHPQISGDGNYLVFTSDSSNLALGASSDSQAIYLANLSTGEIEFIGDVGYFDIGTASISDDGSLVVFASSSALTTDDTNDSIQDIYVYDRATQDLRRYSTDELVTDSNYAENNSRYPLISGDGTTLTFISDIPLEDDNYSTQSKLFVVKLDTSTLQEVASDLDYQSLQQGGLSISADGQLVSFSTRDENTVANDPNNEIADVFLADFSADEIYRVSVADDSFHTQIYSGNKMSIAPAISGNGSVVAFQSEAKDLAEMGPSGTAQFSSRIFINDLVGESVSAISGYANISGQPMSMSNDGQFLVFVGQEISEANSSGAGGLYLYDSANEEVETIAGGASYYGYSEQSPNISGDGKFIVFTSNDNNLVDNDPSSNTQDVFLYDREQAEFSLLTFGANNSSYDPVISDDGNIIAFSTTASDLIMSDTNGQRDIYIYDRQNFNLSLLVEGANAGSTEPDISGDGRFIVFSSSATNLSEADTNGGRQDIFIFDRTDSSLELLTPGSDRASADPAISADGRFVTFRSSATNLTETTSTGYHEKIFRLDRETGTTIEITTGATLSSARPGISADGQTIVFQSDSEELAPDGNGKTDVFIYRDGAAPPPPPAMNSAPVFTSQIGNQTVVEGETLSITLSAMDDDNDPVDIGDFPCDIIDDSLGDDAYRFTEIVRIDDSSAQITWTPQLGDAGSYCVTLGVEDYDSTGATMSFVVTVLNQPGSGRITDDLLALYTFSAGSGNTIVDRSGVGDPLDLVIEVPSAVSWGNGTLDVQNLALIRSADTASKISRAVYDSGEITLEAWVQSSDLSQTGPARIVTISADNVLRNITLGQGGPGGIPGTAVSVRNRLGGDDGAEGNGKPALITNPGQLDGSLKHLVYTRSADGEAFGEEIFYIDGVEVERRQRYGTFDNWASDYRLILASEANGSKPWFGKLDLVAFYGVALNPAEVAHNYAAGTDAGEPVEPPEPPGPVETPSLTVSATVSEQSTSRPGPEVNTGSSITVSYSVLNDGATELSNVEVRSRVKLPELGSWREVCTISTISVGETGACNADETVSEGLNKALVVARTSVDGEQVQSLGDVFFQGVDGGDPGGPTEPVTASISLMSDIGGLDLAKPGPILSGDMDATVNFAITNNGDLPLTDIELFFRQKLPELEPWLSVCAVSELAAGEQTTCELPVGTVDAGVTYKAISTVNAKASDGSDLTATVIGFARGAP